MLMSHSATSSPPTSPDTPAPPPPAVPPPSLRIQVELNPDHTCTVVSYADLHRQRLQSLNHTLPPKRGDYNDLLDRLEKRAEREVIEENGKQRVVDTNEYDVEDPFIDDADLFLEDLIETQQRQRPEKYQGFFVLQGALGDVIADEEEDRGVRKRKQRTRITHGGKRARDGSENEESEGDAERRKKKVVVAAGGDGSSAENKRKKAEESDRGEDKKDKKIKVKRRIEEEGSGRKKIITKGKAGEGGAGEGEAKKKKKKENTDGDVSKTPVKRQSTSTGDGPIKKEKLESLSSLTYATMENGDSSLNGISIDTGIPGDGKKSKSKKNDNISLEPLDDRVQAFMEQLKAAATKESFETKSKFPDSLRPIVVDAGCIVLKDTNEVDDNFLNHLMSILPYNRLTLRKFVTRNVLRVKIDNKTKDMKIALESFADKVQSAMAPLIASADQAEPLETGSSPATAPPTVPPTMTTSASQNSSDVPPESQPLSIDDDNAEEKKEGEDKHRKFRWTDDLRQTLFDVVQLEMEIADMNNVLSDVSQKLDAKVACGTVRKTLYQKLLVYWPDNWMSSVEIGRQYSEFKRKLEKKGALAKANSGDLPTEQSKAKVLDSGQLTATKKPRKPKSVTADGEPPYAVIVKKRKPRSKESETDSPTARKPKPLPFAELQHEPATEASTPNSLFEVSSILTPSPGGFSENSNEEDGARATDKGSFDPMRLDNLL